MMLRPSVLEAAGRFATSGTLGTLGAQTSCTLLAAWSDRAIAAHGMQAATPRRRSPSHISPSGISRGRFAMGMAVDCDQPEWLSPNLGKKLGGLHNLRDPKPTQSPCKTHAKPMRLKIPICGPLFGKSGHGERFISRQPLQLPPKTQRILSWGAAPRSNPLSFWW